MKQKSYKRLLKQFRDAFRMPWSEGFQLIAVPLNSPKVREMYGWDDFDRVGLVYLPHGKDRESHLYSVHAPNAGVLEGLYDAFAQLGDEGGTALPPSIRDALRQLVAPNIISACTGVEWWLTFLWWQIPPDTKNLALGETAKGRMRFMSLGAFYLESADAIERCGLAARDSINAWIDESTRLITPVSNPAKPEVLTARHPKRHSTSDSVPKRSWNQSDLDDAIREYKVRRASRYSDLVDGVKRGRPGAKKATRELCGRNVIVRELGVKSGAMVSNSPVWQEIADELRLRGQPNLSKLTPEQRIGIEIASEQAAVASDDTVVDQVVQRETIAMVRRSMSAPEADVTIEKLRLGEITDEEARELITLTADQKQDDRSRTIRQSL